MDADKVREAFAACLKAGLFPDTVTRSPQFRMLKFHITGEAEIDPPANQYPDRPLTHG